MSLKTSVCEVTMPVRPLLWVVGVLCLAVVIAPAFAADNQPSDPLIRVLQSKGILTPAEADSIGTVAPADQRSKLAEILLNKGLITASDYQAVNAAAPAYETVNANGGASYQPAVLTNYDPAQAAAPSAPKAPPVIPAVAPIRVLQTEPSKVGGLVPDIKLGSGAKLKLYGFFKSSVVYDTTMQTGNDFPLPGFSGDTGPNGSPEFHLKARASRFGGNFEWPDIRPGTSITGKIEFDWEGNFSAVQNRNISSIRSNMPSLRLAYARIDHMLSDQTSIFALFGQDWTPFGSSILPNSLETTGLGLAFGSMYTRAPQVRVGLFHKFEGTSFAIGPEFAITYPGFGNSPPFIGIQTLTVPAIPACAATPCPGVPATVVGVGTTSGNFANQIGYGERQGADAQRPEVEGRLVLQFQLDHAKGVAPAQVIISAMQGARTVIIPKANVPLCTAPAVTNLAPPTPVAAFFPVAVNTPRCGNGAGGQNADIFKAAFPTGTTVDTSRNGWTGGFQLPTRYVTFIANYYRGTDLRWFFAGQLQKEFNNFTIPGATATGTAGTANTVGCPGSFNCGVSIDGASVIAFASIDPGASGGNNTIPQVIAVPQGVIRTQGGFAELGFPLSRLFGADPTGRNAGWTLNLHYGLDNAFARDIKKVGANVPYFSSWSFGNLQYKLNQYVTFGYELGYYWTRDASTNLFAGAQHHVWHDTRSEFATIFTF